MTATIFRRNATNTKPIGPFPRLIGYKLLNGYPKITMDYQNFVVVEKYIVRANEMEAFIRHSFPRNPNRVLPKKSTSDNVEAELTWLHDVSHDETTRMLPGTDNSLYRNQLQTRDIRFSPLTPDLPGDPLNAHLRLRDPRGNIILIGEEAFPDVTHADTYQDYYTATITYDVYQGKYLHTMRAGGQFLSVPAQNTKTYASEINGVEEEETKWDTANKHLIEDKQLALYRSRVTISHTLRWMYLVDPNFQEISRHLGKLNSGAFPLLNNAPPNTCLFMGYRARRLHQWNPSIYLPTGEKKEVAPEIATYELELTFSEMNTTVVDGQDEDGNDIEKVYGWNHIYDSSQSKWVYVTAGDENKSIYERYDFTEVLRKWPGVQEATDVFRLLAELDE